MVYLIGGRSTRKVFSKKMANGGDSLAGQTFSFSHNTSLREKMKEVWYITVEQSVQATTAFARHLWPPRQQRSKLTTASSREFHCTSCTFGLSVYFSVTCRGGHKLQAEAVVACIDYSTVMYWTLSLPPPPPPEGSIV